MEKNPQFSSLTQSWLTLCDVMDCSMPGFPVHHHSQSLLKIMSPELVMVSNHLILCHPLSSPTPSAFSLSQHQGFFQLVGSLQQLTKVLERQLQDQSFQ